MLFICHSDLNSHYRLKKAQGELDIVTSQLKEKQDKLGAIEAKVIKAVTSLFTLHVFVYAYIDS